MFVINYTEIAVKNVINELFESFRGTESYCACEICKSRAAAMALNDLQPQYVVSEAEFMAAKAQYQSPAATATLIAIVMDAIRKVITNPRHETRLLNPDLKP